MDWAITAYTDQDPLPGVALDYRGRQYTFDGSDSLHFALTDYAAMDRGIEVYAAAPGTVVEVNDGEFDRHHQLSASVPDNYVLIDHGGGWQTRYGRLRNGSVAVSPGQVVTGGQRIGLVGGSGGGTRANQGAPYLKFNVRHQGNDVETFLAPEVYWQSPPPFAGDVPGVHYMATAETVPSNNAADGFQVAEHISSRHVFHPGERAYVLTVWHGLNREAPRQYRYFRPNGTQALDVPNTTAEDRPQAWRQGFVNLTGANAQLGTWEVAVELNGVELGRTSFLVADPSEGLPEIKVYQGSTYVIDGRTTPIDFGSAAQGGGVTRRLFTLLNYGTQPLTLGQITAPDGFTIFGTPPTSIPAGGSSTLEIQLDDQVGGGKSGRVVIRTNDADQGEFDFAVKGTIAPAPPPAVTKVSLSSSDWQPAFRQFLADQGTGSAALGFAVPGGATQLDELPWANLNQVSVTFSHEVQVDAADLAVRGVSVAEYPLDGAAFTYDAGAKTATWRLAPGHSFGNDRITLGLGADVAGGVRNAFGVPLDGDWINPVGAAAGGDAFPSGDGAPGGDFRFAINILPGDTTGDGIVLARDFADVKKKFFKDTTSPVEGADLDYSPFHDIDGSGAILARDYAEVKKRFFDELPAPQPAATGLFSSTTVAVAQSRTARPPRRGVLDERPADRLAR